MLRVLVASQPIREGWLGGTALSTMTHAMLIAALTTTAGVPSSVREVRATVSEQVTYILPRMMEFRKSNTGKRRVGEGVAPKAPVLDLDLPEVTVPTVDELRAVIDQSLTAPDIALNASMTAMLDGWLAQADDLANRGPSTTEILMARSALQRPADGVYSPDMVEVSVAPKRGNPLPNYPSSLREMGVEGSFVVRFVVDSTGRVPDDKIGFPSSMHRLFVEAVRTALHRSRYTPARIGGHPVTELVVQEFRFQLRK